MNTAKKLLFGLGLLAFTILGEWPRSLLAADEIDQFQGTWRVVSFEHEGEVAPEEIHQDTRWQFAKDHLTITEPKIENREFSFSVKSSGARNEIDLVLPESEPEEGSKKKPVRPTMLGIYQFEDGKLKICCRDSQSSKLGRPKKFETTPESQLGMTVLERVSD